MEKIKPSQIELFSQIKDYNQKKEGASESFWSYIRNYEKTIFIILGLIITGIVSFALGVQRGRLADKTQISKPVKTVIAEQASTVKLQEEPRSAQNYTIQIATYQTKTYAQKEADSLKKRGFAPLILPKGTYTIVCVGNFSDQKTAKPLLSELKKRYQDCFMRRL